jgi:hypothetical protein
MITKNKHEDYMEEHMKTQILLLKNSIIAVLMTIFLVGCGSNDTPTTFFDGIRDAATNNDPVAVWNTIPHSMQKESDSIVHELGNKLPAEFYDSTWKLIRRISSLLETKKNFILNTPVVKMGLMELSAQEQLQFNASYDNLIPAISALSESQLATTDGLKKFNTTKFLSRNGNIITTALVSFVQIAATQERDASAGLQAWQALSSIQANTVSIDGNTAVVETTIALPAYFSGRGVNDNQTVSMTQVEGKWIPADLQNGFSIALAEAKNNIATTDFSINGQQMLGMAMAVSLADNFLQPLEQASTQEEFDAAVMKLTMMF